MPQNAHLEIVTAEAQRLPPAEHAIGTEALRSRAVELARSLTWLPNTPTSRSFRERSRALARRARPLFASLEDAPPKGEVSDEFRWLYDNGRLLYSEMQDAGETLKRVVKTPHVRTPAGVVVPRALAVAEGFLSAVGYEFTEQQFVLFLEAFQEHTVLDLKELWAMVPAAKLVLLEQICARGQRLLKSPGEAGTGVSTCVRSLRDIGQTTWKDVLEPLIVFDRILRRAPAGAYAQMEFESRDLYRNKLSNLADHCDHSEIEVANTVLEMAQQAAERKYDGARQGLRELHVGFYLLDKGKELLHQRVGFRPPFTQRFQALLKKHPDEYFIPGIEVLTFVVVLTCVSLLTETHSSLGMIIFAILALLLPSSQSAVQLMNYLTTALLPAEILPKLDFSEGIPADCVTLVAVPSLLLSEKQVRGLADDLEVRYLGNHDPHVHFALVTDLPESREPAREDSPLINLCSDLVRELNERYAGQGTGSFYLFHRHRVYNPREGAWMGWERKRGKLLDLNKLLRGQYDSFPVKVGDLSVLPQVRYVITLDSDTELPRGSAHRMVGTMAHPLNQAIIDPEKNLVVAGHGILQPRVGVSVQSTSRSRLAAIYAGETGFDIYTRAISDAYQDLYGEGIFTGKGIYEVETIHKVLDRRFPQNSLLSHDLIEGAYARAGLVSDIEVIEDYPAHYSAYNRRKHRWLRGDWQIAGWLFPHVGDEAGARVPNPISLISKWKIFDNLRRSLVEPATFLLIVFGWLLLSGNPIKWTIAAIAILFIPAWFQLLFDLVRAAVLWDSTAARDALSGFYAANLNAVFTLTFLAHQALLSLDAVVRAMVRRLVTRQRLLEWETAAESELDKHRRTPVDHYLDWMPVLAFGLGLLVLVGRPQALYAALPVLLLWASSEQISSWMNRPSVASRSKASRRDVEFLRRSALSTWRYFAEFSTREHNWLVPDNVQEEPPAIAGRLSPTNLGFLLNARQVACEFGYLTVTEFAEQSLRTLATAAGLPKYRGHLLNWYDTRTLQPLAPLFVSSVDSGNLMASLWTLQQGCLDRLRQPLLQPCLLEGVLDHLRALAEESKFPRRNLTLCQRELRTDKWLPALLALSPEDFDQEGKGETPWSAKEAAARVRSVRQLVRFYAPWHLPEFAVLRRDPALNLRAMDKISLSVLPEFIDGLEYNLAQAMRTSGSEDHIARYERLRGLLPGARTKVEELLRDLRSVSTAAGKLADEMEFGFLLDRRRKLISVGFDVDTKQLHPACYDLLGTESRTAVFVAIAKEDIPQECWFLLGRAHTLDRGQPVLLSWTGTLFEYLMPPLWMRSYSNTLLDRSRAAAVRAQKAYAARKGTPWGISESAHAKLDQAGNYQYHAFGLANLATRKRENDSLVISPYSTFLALNTDPQGALENLRRMSALGWTGKYGFYEAADYSTIRRRFWRDGHQIVRCWMAHHQGMTFLALANFLHDDVVQRWFHSERRVQATELLLHEKPVAHVRKRDLPRKTKVA